MSFAGSDHKLMLNSGIYHAVADHKLGLNSTFYHLFSLLVEYELVEAKTHYLVLCLEQYVDWLQVKTLAFGDWF
jgi:hypothetical protein